MVLWMKDVIIGFIYFLVVNQPKQDQLFCHKSDDGMSQEQGDLNNLDGATPILSIPLSNLMQFKTINVFLQFLVGYWKTHMM